jgi:hypothetical protein
MDPNNMLSILINPPDEAGPLGSIPVPATTDPFLELMAMHNPQVGIMRTLEVLYRATTDDGQPDGPWKSFDGSQGNMGFLTFMQNLDNTGRLYQEDELRELIAYEKAARYLSHTPEQENPAAEQINELQVMMYSLQDTLNVIGMYLPNDPSQASRNGQTHLQGVLQTIRNTLADVDDELNRAAETTKVEFCRAQARALRAARKDAEQMQYLTLEGDMAIDLFTTEDRSNVQAIFGRQITRAEDVIRNAIRTGEAHDIPYLSPSDEPLNAHDESLEDAVVTLREHLDELRRNYRLPLA